MPAENEAGDPRMDPAFVKVTGAIPFTTLESPAVADTVVPLLSWYAVSLDNVTLLVELEGMTVTAWTGIATFMAITVSSEPAMRPRTENCRCTTWSSRGRMMSRPVQQPGWDGAPAALSPARLPRRHRAREAEVGPAVRQRSGWVRTAVTLAASEEPIDAKRYWD